MNVNIMVKGTFAVIAVALICGTYLIAISDYPATDVPLAEKPKLLYGILLIAFGVIAFFLVPWREYRRIRIYK